MSKRKQSAGIAAQKKAKESKAENATIAATTIAISSSSSSVSSSSSLSASSSLLSIEEELNLAISRVKEGIHPEIVARTGGLLRIKDKRCAAADRHRKLQYKNINDLFDYEVQDAEAVFQKAYGDTQEKLINEMKAEAQRIQALRSITSKSSSSSTSSSSSSSSSSAVVATTALSSIAGTGGIETEASLANGELNLLTGRSLRSNANEGDADGGNLTQLNKEKQRRKGTAAVAPAVLIHRSLPEQSVREDFLFIVKDIESRAAKYTNANANNTTQAALKVAAGEDCLSIGSENFYVGDLVVVFSTLSQESLCGVITALSPTEIVVRCGGGLGTRFSFRVGQIREGRVTISRDHEAKANLQMIKGAAHFVAVSESLSQQSQSQSQVQPQSVGSSS